MPESKNRSRQKSAHPTQKPMTRRDIMQQAGHSTALVPWL